MPDRIGDAAVGVIGTLALGVLAWARARRRDEADTRAVLSADNREWAAVFLARLAHTEGKLDATEAELETERQAHAETRGRLSAAEHKISDLQRDLAALVREVRRLGGHVPGDTPADGTPAVKG